MVAQTLAETSSRRRPSPLWALLWEEWRQTRAPLLAGTGFVLLAMTATLAATGWTITWPFDSDEYYLCTWLLGLLLLWQVGTLLFSGYGRNDLGFTFPRRLFTLPVPSTTLALVRIGYGAAVMAVTFGPLGWILSTTGDEFGPGVAFAAVAVQALLYVQAVAWTLGRRPAVAAVVGVFAWAPFAFLGLELFRLTRHLGFGGLLLPTLLNVAVFTAVAVAGVVADRRGTGIGKSLRLRVAALLGRQSYDESDPFPPPPSPKQAQFGYEWRRRTLPTLWVALGTGALVAMAYLLLIYAGRLVFFGPGGVLIRVQNVVMQMLMALTAAGTTVGLLAAGIAQRLIDERERASGLGRFIAVRPQGTAAIAAARLKALASGTVIVQVVPLLLAVLVMAPTEFGARFLYDFLFNRPPSHPGVFVLFLMWILLGWSLLTMPLTSCVVFWAMVSTAESAEYALNSGRAVTFTHWLPMLAVLLAIAAWGLRKAFMARRLGLVSDGRLLVLAAAWLFTWALLYARFGPDLFLTWDTLASTRVATALALAVAALVPYLPFAAVPLAVHRQRHR